MNDLASLAAEVAKVTGADLPAVLEGDAPVPAMADQGDVYFVGLIGGKDVGKTSLANAIAGADLGKPTGVGEGTRTVTAYAHRSAVHEVKRRLGDVTIVPHELESLRRQVLLDLPDIDSRYADHVQLTRHMLRHLLYPVWVQSVEKYADARPRDLLKQVAAGNDPGNFIFVLSKADQLVDREGTEAALELADDYANRIADTLELPAKPEVLLCSAHRPGDLDLPRLQDRLGVERDHERVRSDVDRAGRRLSATVAGWVREQNLPELADAARRRLDLATELVTSRAAGPVLEVALPRLADDPGHRAAVAEPAARERVRAWPLVGWIDVALTPLVSLVRQNLMPASTEAALLERHLADAGQDTAAGIRSAFAALRATHPDVADLYATRHLWETAEAEAAASDLRRRLSAALDTQRDAIRHRLRPTRWLLPIRWLLTVGVVVWFAVVQPLLEVFVPRDEWSWTELLREAVLLLNAQTLLASIGFCISYLIIVWVAVRLRAYKLVARQRRKLLAAEDDEASPAHQVVAWTADLLRPLRDRHAVLARLAERGEQL